MPKVFVSPTKKFKWLLRPSPRGQTQTQPGDDLDNSEKATNLWEKNNKLIKGLGKPLDSKKNETLLEEEKTSEQVETKSVETSINVAELADQILSELKESMKRIFSLAETDPVFLRTCFEIIEVQRRKDEFAEQTDHKENEIQRPLRWDQICLTELQSHLRNRLKSASEFNEENSAIFLQEIIQNLDNDLKTIRNFVKKYQPNDDYVFLTVAEAYRSHLYNLMDKILHSELSETQLNSVLIFHGDFRRKFDQATYPDFWQERDNGTKKLHIMPEAHYEELVERYLQKQAQEVKELFAKIRRVEIEWWLSEKTPQQKNQKVFVTQWPVDVLDMCQQQLDVSQKIGPETYYKVLSLLKRELEEAIMLYGAGAKYYIQPEKNVLPSIKRHPEFEILKRRRGTASQDPPPCFNECVVHAILNNFPLFHKHLSKLSQNYKDENGCEQFATLQTLVREQAENCLRHYREHHFQPSMEKYSKRLLIGDWWSSDSPVTVKFCEEILTYITCLDSEYFEDWFEIVREKVHLVYLKAISKRCHDVKCKNSDDRNTVASRFEAEKRKLEKTVQTALPCYKEQFIELLDQAAAVVGCEDKDTCSTEVYVLKAKQQRIITADHLKSILVINGSFKSKHQRKIIGALFRTDEVESLAEPRVNPICSQHASASSSDEEAPPGVD